MTKQILREAYDRALANAPEAHSYPIFWLMSLPTSWLMKSSGEDFCGLPVDFREDMALGEWILYVGAEDDPLWIQHVANFPDVQLASDFNIYAETPRSAPVPIGMVVEYNGEKVLRIGAHHD